MIKGVSSIIRLMRKLRNTWENWDAEGLLPKVPQLLNGGVFVRLIHCLLNVDITSLNAYLPEFW